MIEVSHIDRIIQEDLTRLIKHPPKVVNLTPEIEDQLTEQGRKLHEAGKLPDHQIKGWINEQLVKMATPLDKLEIIRMKAEAEKLKRYGYSFEQVRRQLLQKFNLNTASNE